MYKNFFGFKERPFQLVPNPAYLFLSRSHEEALAHLTYAISQGDGFVEITGEVGTGKTTLCRAFLENLDRDTEAAYIFNPKLDSVQLLKAVNDEFGIPSKADNTKDLIDGLNAFLIEKKGEGKRVILLIDEAQNLSQEVLEQVRLLSNLETTTSKLLQIILVGQPELGEMLDSHELRQLGQRITLSCHINPLTYRETREYIRHRVQVATQKTGVRFTRAALRTIYRYSGGIPRLINIACDRALLTAFGLNQQGITGGIARAAVRELAGRGDVRRFSLQEGRRTPLFVGMLFLALLLLVFYRPGDLNINGLFQGREADQALISRVRPLVEEKGPGVAPGKGPPREEVKEVPDKGPPREEVKEVPDKGPPREEVKEAPDQGPIQAAPRETALASAETETKIPLPLDREPPQRPVRKLADVLKEMTPRSSRTAALTFVLNLWNPGSTINRYLENMDDDSSFFRLAARQNGLSVNRVEGGLETVKKLDLPAVLEMYRPGGLSPRYLALLRMEDRKMVLRGDGEDGAIETDRDELTSNWSGVAYVPWKNFLDYGGIIPLNAPRDSIITLKMLMKDIGFTEIEISPFYDEKTREAVKLVQERHGIRVDGIVGPLTKIVLYNEKRSLGIPHIVNQ
jgi:general secretion pathway protein A